MILTFIKCEMCMAQVKVSSHFPSDSLPDTWLTVCEGNPQTQEGRHFCSLGCLNIWCISQGGEHGPLLPAGDFDYLSRAQKDDVRELHAAMVKAFKELDDKFSANHPELNIDWRFQLETRIRQEQLV